MFADDVYVFGPSMSLSICDDCAAEHEITFNCNKTIDVSFCPQK